MATTLCDPCQARTRTVTASYWCAYCGEAFCKHCCQFHQTMKMTRTHKVLPIAEVSEKEKRGNVTNRGKLVDLTTETFTEKTQLKEIDNMLLYLDSLGDVALNLKKLNFDMKMKNENRKAEAMRKVRIFKNRLKELADDFENHVNIELEKLQTSENGVIDGRIDECETLFNAIEMSKDLTQNLKIDDINTSTLTKVNATRHRCSEFKFALQRVHSKMQLVQYNLAIDRNLAEALDHSPSVIGKIEVTYEDGVDAVVTSTQPPRQPSATAVQTQLIEKVPLHMTQAEKLHEIYLQKKEDLDEPMICSMRALVDGNYLMLDRNNDKLLLYRPDGTLVIQYVFTSQVWDMALVDIKTAAVTLPDNDKIVFVKIRDSALCAERVIKTPDSCFGICAILNYLIVTVKGGFVKILTKVGEEVACIRYNIRGEIIFVDPQYVTTNADQTLLYVSDFKRQTVTAMRLSGIKIDADPHFIYTDPELQNPTGLTVDSQGNIYVCGFASHNVHQISPEGNKVKVILEKVVNPQTPCLAVTEERLLVSSLLSDAKSKQVENVIEVFRLF